jgi:hypothetical protein
VIVGVGDVVVVVVDGEAVLEVVGGVLDRDEDVAGGATTAVDRVTVPVVGVVLSAVVDGEGSTAMVWGIVVGAVGTVVPELAVTRLSPELVVGRAITTANMARRTTAAAAPSNGAGLASAAVISRPIRP